MELIGLFFIGCVVVGYFISQNNKPDIQGGIDRLNNDVAKQRAKLTNPDRNSI